MVNNKPLCLQAFWNVKGPIKGKAIFSKAPIARYRLTQFRLDGKFDSRKSCRKLSALTTPTTPLLHRLNSSPLRWNGALNVCQVRTTKHK